MILTCHRTLARRLCRRWLAAWTRVSQQPKWARPAHDPGL